MERAFMTQAAVAVKSARTGVNLHGVVKTTEVAVPAEPVELGQIHSQIETVIAALPTLKTVPTQDGRQKVGHLVIGAMKDAVNARIAELRTKTFRSSGNLPPSLLKAAGYGDELERRSYNNLDEMGRMSESPRALLSDLRQLAHDLGFLIIPYDYLSWTATAAEWKPVERQISNFKGAAGKLDFATYIMAPPAYYGVMEHAKAKNPNQFCFDGQHDVMMGLTRQNVYTFRTVFEALNGLGDKIDDIRMRVSRAEENILGVQRQVAGLNGQVQRIQADLLRTKMEVGRQLDGLAHRVANAEAAAQHATELAQMVLCMLDPLMFAIPSSTNLLSGETAAYIGPCWGPDFPAIMAQAYRTGTFDPSAQDANLTARMRELWG
jgi:hypothetical protein